MHHRGEQSGNGLLLSGLSFLYSPFPFPNWLQGPVGLCLRPAAQTVPVPWRQLSRAHRELGGLLRGTERKTVLGSSSGSWARGGISDYAF